MRNEAFRNRKADMTDNLPSLSKAPEPPCGNRRCNKRIRMGNVPSKRRAILGIGGCCSLECFALKALTTGLDEAFHWKKVQEHFRATTGLQQPFHLQVSN